VVGVSKNEILIEIVRSKTTAIAILFLFIFCIFLNLQNFNRARAILQKTLWLNDYYYLHRLFIKEIAKWQLTTKYSSEKKKGLLRLD
jgi:hypothetical protein